MIPERGVTGMAAALFAGAALLFAALYFMLRRSLKHAVKQLRELQPDLQTNRQLRFHCPDKHLEELLEEVNLLLASRQSERILHERKEEQIRKQIADITHDLRTPLTSMLGYIELLREEGIHAEEAADYLNVVKKRCEALRALIAGFYDLSRIETGDYPVLMQRVDLQLLLKRVLADFYTDFIAGGFHVEVDLQETSHYIMADEEVVTRIYMNLLQNVVKHGQNKLHVFQGMKEGDWVTVISNETAVLQPEDVPYLFERAYTSNRERSGQNTGLGLAVVKGLIQQMGYDVSAQYTAPLFTICLHWQSRLH